MLDDFKVNQKVVYQMLKNAGAKRQFSHAYLVDANHYPRKLEFAMALAKFILCENHYSNSDNCVNCTQCKRIDDGNFTELKIISPDGAWIKKEQLEELQKQFSTKAIESSYKIYIINEAEKMNSSASNSILKFLEEPEPGIIAILITDNMYQLLDTIISRCQVISLAKVSVETEKRSQLTTIEKLAFFFSKTGEEYQEFIQDEEKKEQIEYVMKMIQEIEKNKERSILKENKYWTSIFNDKEKLEFALQIMLLFYKDAVQEKIGLSLEFMDDYQGFLKTLAEQNTTQQLCKKMELIMELRKRIKININQNLLIDQLILSFVEV